MSDYQSKIIKLKEIYTKPKDQAKLIKTEKALRKAIFNQKLMENEVIEKIIESAKEDVENINLVLTTDETLNEAGKEYDRKLLFEKRNWIKENIIDRFSCADDKAIQINIEKSIQAIEDRANKFLSSNQEQ